MALIEDNDVVQKIASTTFNPSLRSSVLPRTSERGPQRPNRHRPHCDGDFQSILSVPIKDEQSGSRLVGEGFPQLLHDPIARGMPGNIEMQYPTASVVDDEHSVEHTERESRLHRRPPNERR